MNPIELVATALGLLNQWLTVHQRVLCWPVGIASVALYAWVFREAKLYSDVLLQGIYAALQLYGWWNWTRLRAHRETVAPRRLLHVRRLDARGWVLLAAAVAAVTAALGGAMARWTDAAFPFYDAGATALSLAGQTLQALKILESWPVFIVANLVFIALYVAKGLYATVFLFVVLTGMAIWGFRRWAASMPEAPRAATPAKPGSKANSTGT